MTDRTHGAEVRAQLVHVPIRSNARVRLGDAGAVEQAGLTAVAGPGVDFHRDDYPTSGLYLLIQ